MPAPVIPYIRWVKDHFGAARYSLSLSSVRALRQDEDEAGFLELDHSGYDFGECHIKGSNALRVAIGERYGAEPKEVFCATGSSHANFLAASVLLGPGDEAVVENPGYGPLQELPRFFGADPVILERRYDEGFTLELERLKGLVGRRTRMVILTSLHNPSGVGIPEETLRGAVEIAEDAGAWVLCDEVYRDFVPDRFPSAWGMGDNVIVTSSLTKFAGMGGCRMGWALVPRKFSRQMSDMNDYVQIVSSRPSEFIGEAAFARMDRIVERSTTIARENRAVVDRWMEGEERVEWVPPDGGIIGFPRLTARDGMPVSSLGFTEHMLERHDALAGPGCHFGSEGHVRVGFGGDGANLEEGLRRLSLALDTWVR